jgi:hypothetical protein
LFQSSVEEGLFSPAAGVSTVAKSGKSNDISHDMSMAKSDKADVAYDMSMTKSGKANVSYNEMSMMDNAAQRTGGKTAKQAKSKQSVDNLEP